MKRLTGEDRPGTIGLLDGIESIDGDRITLRHPMLADREALNAMLARCSLASRYGRFLGPVRHFPPGHLEAVTLPPEEVEAWIAVLGDGGGRRVLALASLHQQGPDRAELALLVEDACQRRGLGTRLLVRLAEAARRRGLTVLHATVLSEHTHVLRLLQTVLGPIHTEQETGTTAVTVPLTETWLQGAAVAKTMMLDR